MPEKSLDAQRDATATDRVRRAVREVWPPVRWNALTVLVGVSGGGDSVALLRTLHQLAAAEPSRPPTPGRLVVAHFNHATRGPASDDDERFVRRLAEELRLDAEFGRAASRVSGARAGENALRDARYAFFYEAAARRGARYLCLAHTRDDQVETVAHRIFRGTGIAGLAGMAPFRSAGSDLVIARPLLGVERRELRRMLKELGQPYRDDATNDTSAATRNWLRNELLPRLGERYPAAADSLVRLAENARDAHAALQWAARSLYERTCRDDGARGVAIDCQPLRGVPAGVVLEVVRAAWRGCGWPEAGMSRAHWLRLAAAVEDPARPPFDLPGGVHVESEGERLRLVRK